MTKLSSYHLSAALCCVIALSACSSSKVLLIEQDDLQGSWSVELIEQKPVLEHSQALFTFDENNRVSGISSCNRIMASYTLSHNNKQTELTFGQSAGTMMMCPEALMDQEQRFLAAMPKVKAAKIEKNMLILMDESGQLIFKASKQN